MQIFVAKKKLKGKILFTSAVLDTDKTVHRLISIIMGAGPAGGGCQAVF